MEILVVNAHHKGHYGSRGKKNVSRGFKAINCRAFQSQMDVLPSSQLKPRMPNCYDMPKSPKCDSEPPKQSSKSMLLMPTCSKKRATFSDDVSFSELWAGPAYVNSPPPSSVPIPKFSLCQNRSDSMELLIPRSDVIIHATSKSAPAPPTSELCLPPNDIRLDTATETLRRILNLEALDD